jgi:acetoin utilization deacetylase AcuC-like enzyme
MVKTDKSIFTFSMHCESNFPLKKQISDLDVPLKKGMKDNTYLKILGSSLEKLEDNDTDIIFFQAGVDGLVHDTLGHLSLSHQGMMKRNEMVLSFCKKKRCPVVIFMGGGYSKPISHTVKAFSELFFQFSNL